MSAAPRAYELFELADLMSALLRAIEVGLFDTGPDAETLYLPIAGNEALVSDMNRIIDLWQSATGDRVKDRPAGQPAQPVRLPTVPTTASVPASGARAAGASPVPAGTAPQPVLAGQNGHG
jgi:hypothetical protein